MSDALPVAGLRSPESFAERLRDAGLAPLRRGRVTTLQINVGKLCNQACHHCHVDAGPKRTENMSRRTAERLIELLDASPGIELVDVTGGAPEMNANFRYLVAEVRKRGFRFIDRCNLTVLLIPGQEDTAELLADHQVELVASLPCYQPANVARQRGTGVFEKSIAVLERLNALGYGRAGSGLLLDLVYNPVGPSLPPDQATLEATYKKELGEHFGIEFNRLLTITNMPIKRFADMLQREGKYDTYMGLLVNHFNPGTVQALMCRSLVSIGYDGTLYDCDFNQMLELEAGAAVDAGLRTIWDLKSFADLDSTAIATDHHCFGCTAGSGSSCAGAIE